MYIISDMEIFKRGNPITEKQMEILQRVVEGKSSRENYTQSYPKDLVKVCQQILKKPKKYTSKDVSPIINEIFKY